MPFTKEELEAMRLADEEIEREFMITDEEREDGNRRDRISKMENSSGREAKKREYREANREKIAAKQREWYEANREKVLAQQREYREANREKIAEKRSQRREGASERETR